MNTFVKIAKAWGSPVLFLLAVLSHATFAKPDFVAGNVAVSDERRGDSRFDAAQPAAPSKPKISPADAADLVRKKTGGQVINVQTQRRDAGVVYGVKVLNSGRMKVIHVDGETGQILNN